MVNMLTVAGLKVLIDQLQIHGKVFVCPMCGWMSNDTNICSCIQELK